MTVLVTRPNEKGKQLVDLLAQAGVFAIHLPLFHIEAGRELNNLPQKLSQLKTGDYVFAVSQPAIQYAQQTLQQVGQPWRKDLCYFAVGRRSAEYFASQSERAVIYPPQLETSEGLLALAEMQQVADKQVLILRGNGGRELFADQMRARGAQVDTLECYQRVPISYNNEEQVSLCQRAGIDTIVVTSTEILRYLIDFVPEKEHNWLKNCQLVTISERIAHLAKNQGWHSVKIAAQADNQSILNTLCSN